MRRMLGSRMNTGSCVRWRISRAAKARQPACMQPTTQSTIAITSIEALEGRVVPATLFAVTDTNHLIHFESTSPGTIDGDVEITGLQTGENIAGIDFRPATGELYALGVVDPAGTNNSVGRIYKLDLETGAATQVGAAPFSVTLQEFVNQGYGFDFNPVTDEIRFTNLSQQNHRIDPDTGTVIEQDAQLNETSQGAELITGIAYTNNYAGAATTTVFGIDWVKDKLVRIGGFNGNPTPNNGQVTVIGSLGHSFSTQSGFDIAADGTAFLAGTSGGKTSLYTVDLNVGGTTKLDDLGWVGNLRGLSVYVPEVTISTDGKSATYTDVDGDLVTLKTSKGKFDPTDLVLSSAGGLGRAELVQINLSDDGSEFAGANLSFTIKKSATGDGLADVGWINSTGVDLGKVVVKGDLGFITAGDNDQTTLGLGALTVRGFGDGLDAGSLITGNSGPVKIAGDLDGSFSISGAGSSVTIGGDVTGLVSAKSLTKVVVGGNLDGVGGFGGISISQTLGSVKIGKNVLGGPGSYSGSINGGTIGSVTIGGDVVGGDGAGSGVIIASSSLGNVKIGGDIQGGTVGGPDSLRLSGGVFGTKVGAVTVGGSIFSVDVASGTGGFIGSASTLGAVTVKGDLVGTEATPVRIIAPGLGANLPAGAKTDLAIAKVTVGGRVENADILAGHVIRPYGEVLLDFSIRHTNSNGSIGAVSVGKDWIASNLVAGARNLGANDMEEFMPSGNANDDDVNFGDTHDKLIASPAADALVAKIASVAIKGRVLGSEAMGDHFGFVAQQIGKFSAAGTKIGLTTGTDAFISLAPLTGDVKIREI